MKVKSFRKEKTYIPEFNENRSLTAEDQVTVEIKSFPTNSEVGQYKQFSFAADGAVRINYNDSMILSRHIGKIKNLEDEDGAIKDGAELARSTNLFLSDLISEIRNYLLDTGEELDPGEK